MTSSVEKRIATVTKGLEKLAHKSDYRNLDHVVTDFLMFSAFSVIEHRPYSDCFGFLALHDSITKQLRDRQEHIPALAVCVSEYMNAIKESAPFEDLLFDILAPLGSSSLGQHFTPPDVADLLGAFQELSPDKIESGGAISIGDITGCGTGSLLLGAMRHTLATYGEGVLSRFEVLGIDIDPVVCNATFAALAHNWFIHRLRPPRHLVVFCGNFITQERYLQAAFVRTPALVDRLAEARQQLLRSAALTDQKNLLD